MADTSELPSWDEAVGQSPDEKSPPTWDEAIKASEPSALSTTTNFLSQAARSAIAIPTPQSISDLNDAQREFVKNTAVGKVMDAFGVGYREGFEAPAVIPDDYQAEAGVKKSLQEYTQTQSSLMRSFQDGVVAPAAMAAARTFNLPFRQFNAVMGGFTEAGNKAGEYAGNPELGGQAGEFLMGQVGHFPAIPHDVATAKINGVLDGEDVYMGLKEPTPQQRTARQAIEAQVEQPAFAPDIHTVARTIEPETFARYDALDQVRDNLRDQIKTMADERNKTVEEQSPFNDQIKELEDSMAGGSKRQKKIAQDKIDDLTDQHNSWVEEQLSSDTPEMTALRQKLQETDYAMRDMAPDVSKAYRAADEQMSPAVEEPAPVAPELSPDEIKENKTRAEETKSATEQLTKKIEDRLVKSGEEPSAAKTMAKDKATDIAARAEKSNKSPLQVYAEEKPLVSNIVADAKPIEEQKAFIAKDVVRQLVEAGRSREEAKTVAPLIADRYEARAAQMGGKLGTAEQLYRREAPSIVAGKSKKAPAGQKELAQTMFQAGDYTGIPGFYSKMYRALDEKLNASGTPKQMKEQIDALAKNNQFKQDELYWSGIKDYLDQLPEQDKKVNKDQVMKWLDNNKVNVQEHILDEEGSPGGFSEHDVHISRAEREDVESTDPDKFDAEVDHYVEMFHDDNTDPEKYFAENPDTSLVEETEDDKGKKEYSWNDDAIRANASESARDSFNEFGDKVQEVDIGNGAHNYKLYSNDDTGEWRFENEDGVTLDSGSGKHPEERANDALWDYLRDQEIIRWSDDENPGSTKYADYQSEGPKENYTELLVTLPEISDRGVRQHDWPEQNVMMHLRFNTRMDAEGKKTMFVEEVQSDWHQQGREKGYKSADASTQIRDLNAKEDEIIQKMNVLADDRLPSNQMREEKLWHELAGERDTIRRQITKLDSGVAAAPFADLNKYSELAMKRVIAWAVENGHDRVAWTTGDQQAERWSGALQRTVQDIDVGTGAPDGSVRVKVHQAGGRDVTEFIKDQVKGSQIIDDNYLELTHEQAAQVFGKGLVEQITAKAKELEDGRVIGPEERKIGGLDLKISDKGMKEVYDKVLVNTANSVIKKFGAKVKAINIDTGETRTVVDESTLPSMEQIREKYKEMMEKKSSSDIEEGRDFNDKWTYYEEDQLRSIDKFLEVAKEKGEDAAIKALTTEDGRGGRLLREAFNINSAKESVHSEQWGFDVTDKMRESVPQGQSLFQAARGKIRLATENSKAIITLFKDANASTFIHETGHQWLDELMKDAGSIHAPDGLKRDADTVRKWLGLASDEAIHTRAHEKFARGFERYMMEGVAPSKALAEVFAKFRDWLNKIYESVTKLRAPINDDIRDVFDRMLSTNPEKTVIAPESGSGKMFADIHEADAETTAPEHAAAAADNIRAERHAIIAKHAPEDLNDIVKGTSAENAGRPAGVTQSNSNENAPEPSSTQESAVPPSAQVSERGNQTPEEVARQRNTEPGSSSVLAKPESRLVDKAGNIRLDNLHTPEDVKEVLRETAKDNDNFMQARRGVISDGEILDLADALGMDPSLLDDRKIGQAFNAEQIVAARKLLIKSATNVRESAAKAATGSKEDILAYGEVRARHQMIQEQVSGITAEAGRALRAFRELKGSAETKQLGEFLKTTDYKTIKTDKLLYQLQEEAKLMQTIDTPQKVSKLVHDSSRGKLKNAILEYYINALISGPVTHARYSVGNALNAIWTPLIEIPTAAAIGKAREVVTGKPVDRVRLGETGAQLHGIYKGSQDGLRAAITAFKTGNSPALPGERSSSMFDQKPPAIPTIVGKAIRIPSKSVAAIHSFFKAIRYEQNIQALAYRKALSENLGDENFVARVAQLTTNPTEEMMKSSTVNSLRELYMSPTKFHSPMGNLVRFTNTYLPAKIIMPFMKIGSQITRNAFIERTPLGLFNADVRENLFSGLPEGDMQAARIITGTALMGAISLMVLEGSATGDGPTDPAQRAVWLLNHKPNSIQIAGITIPYQGLGHLGMLMRFSANMTETASHWNEEEGGKLAVSFIEGMSKGVLDDNFMRGLKDMLDAVYHPQEYGYNYIKQFATNWLPFSVGMGQVARVVDPTQREAKTIFDAARARIPFVSETLQPRRDRFGQPISKDTQANYADDAVVQRMEALNIGVGKLSDKIRGVKLDDQQYDDYARIAGKLTKVRLDAIVKNSGFANLPQMTQIDAIKRTIDTSREAARSLILMQNPGLVKQAIDNKTNKLKE